jgi:hypothetical protein
VQNSRRELLPLREKACQSLSTHGFRETITFL